MELSDEAIQEFKEIYKKEYKREIDDATARILAGRLLNLFKAVYQPSNNQNNEEF